MRGFGTDLRVPVGEGKGELKLLSGSGMLMRSGGSGARTVLFIMTGGSASSTIDWNIRRMFVLGNRNVHLTMYKYITSLNKKKCCYLESCLCMTMVHIVKAA